MAKRRNKYSKDPLPGFKELVSEKAKLHGMSKEFLLSEYRELRRVQIDGMTREALEAECLQFYMTNAKAFTDAKLRWIIAVGRSVADFARGVKEGNDGE